jgi:hypothetical protein
LVGVEAVEVEEEVDLAEEVLVEGVQEAVGKV